ncbi:hypothetical protein LUZ60_014909 [Juncus effusus]|nr:hypothetical protein LUZ60_014909 [Juncus effusus]
MAEIAGDGAPPPLRRIHSSRHLLRHSLKPFLSFPSLPALLLSALLLLAFRSALYFAALRLVSLAESDPSLQNLLAPSASSIAGDSSQSPPPPPRPLVQFTRFPTLETDPFFSAARKPSPPSNYSSFYYSTSASKFVKIPIPPSHTAPFFFSAPPEVKSEAQSKSQASITELFYNHRKEIAFIFYIVALISLAYALLIVAFISVYSSALGIVFYSVVSTGYLKRPLVPLQILLSGSGIGIKRLFEFMFLNWAVKDTILQFLTVSFLASMEDELQQFKLFINGKLMPFSPISLVSPLGHSASLASFFLAWTLIDSLVSVVFTIPPWVELMESNDRRRNKNSVKEGIFLLSLMPRQALFIKWCEAVLCGSLGRSLMVKIGGRFYGGFVYAIVEVYFMVVWLNFYINVRCKEGELVGKRFELKDLEDSLEDLR